MTKQPALFFCVFLFLFLAHFPVFASQKYDITFEDNFTSLNDNVWNINNTGGVINTQNGLLLTANNSRQFPFIFSKNNLIPTQGDYYIKVTYEFPLASPWGDGFGIGNVVPDYGSSQTEITAIDKEFFHFQIWRSLNDLHVFQTRHCLTLSICDSSRTTLFQKNYISATHTLEIRYIGNNFIVYSDGDEINNSALLNSDRRPTVFWIGNPVMLDNPLNWTSLTIKNVQIGKIVEVSEAKTPVIIIPGYGGSWDIGAILAGTTGTSWAVPSFIKNYDGIVQSFKNAGFVEGTDLFVFPYDWRKPLTNLADDLNAFVLSKNLAGKVDLIGHSMGGLVARAYAQKYGVDKVDKILTAGSPHLGLIDMYGLWEGARIWDGVWWQNVLLEIATEVNRLQDESKVAAVRRVSPSIIDLFPTFPFLVSGGTTQAIDTMVQKNSYLKTMNQDISILGDKLTPFWSEDVTSTKNNINIVPRSESDIAEGKWEDGRPAEGDPFGKVIGDGTVTKESAVGPFGAGEKITGWHGDLVASKNNIQKIFTKLGLDTNFATSSQTDSRKKSFVAILRSPGTLEVCDKLLINCNDQLGLYFPEYKLFIFPGYNDEDLSVKVKESGQGNYKLHVGSVENEGTWKTVPGNLKSAGQVDKYLVSGASMTITPTNNSPILTNIGNKNIDEFATLNFTVEATDIDGQTLQYTTSSLPANASFDSVNNVLAFTPDESQGGVTYEIKFTVSDGTFTDEETITITVKEMNNPPTPQEDKFVTNEDSDLTMSATELLANDSDPDSAQGDLTIVSVANPAHGSVLISANNIIFTPSLNYFGLANFVYTVTDGDLTNTATVTITVSPINDVPVAADGSITTNEDTLINIDLAGSDIDDDSLTYAVVSGASHGTLGDIIDNRLSYTPNANYYGSDSFTYKVNDGRVDSLIATVSATVTSVNDAPVMGSIGNKAVAELTNLTFTVNATDPDSTDLTYSLEGAPTGTAINSETGVFAFTPTEAQGPGTYTFTVNVTDGLKTDSEEIVITVNEVNITPVAQEASTSTDEDTPKIITLVGTDSDLPINTLTYAILSAPSHGTVSLVGDQTTYTPTTNYNGTDSFTFEVKDSSSSSPIIFNLLGVATISITVNSVNDAPVASEFSVSTGQEVATAIDLAGSDVDGDSLTYTVVSGAAHGSLGSISGKQLTYTPNSGYHGTDSFTYKVNDGKVDSNTATVNITVDPPPQISSESVNAPSETGVTIVWNTNHPSTSRVIYETVSHPTLGDAPNYGYANSTVEKDGSPKVTSHAVTITGLIAGTTYFYRAVSHGSPEVVGGEKSFTTKGVKSTVSFENSLTEVVRNFTQEVLGETTEATPLATPSPTVLGETKDNATDKNDDIKWWTLSLLIVLLYLGGRHLLKKK